MSLPGLENIPFTDLGMSEDDLNSINDHLTGQSPISARTEQLSIPNHDVQQLLGRLKNLWIQLEDPLDDKIQTTIREICQVTHDTRLDLFNKYKHLVRLCGEDMPQIIDELIEACTLGSKPLTAMMKVSLIAYTAALSKNAKSMLAEIATSSSDLLTLTANVLEQQSDFQTSVENLALTWNNLTTSMTAYTQELDKKTLQLTNLQKSPHIIPRRAPSTESNHTPDAQVGTRLSMIMGFSFRSSYGVLTYGHTGNISFLANNEDGILLASLVEVVKKPIPLEGLLNKDLSRLITRLNDTPSFLQCYNSEAPQIKLLKIRELVDGILDLNNQWIKTQLS